MHQSLNQGSACPEGATACPCTFIPQETGWLLFCENRRIEELRDLGADGSHLLLYRGVLRLLVIYPSSPWLQAWDAIMRWLALFQFMIVPIQICSVQVQESGAIKFANWVRLTGLINTYASLCIAAACSNGIKTSSLASLLKIHMIVCRSRMAL